MSKFPLAPFTTSSSVYTHIACVLEPSTAPVKVEVPFAELKPSASVEPN